MLGIFRMVFDLRKGNSRNGVGNVIDKEFKRIVKGIQGQTKDILW